MRRIVAPLALLACPCTNPLKGKQGTLHSTDTQGKTSEKPAVKRYIRHLLAIWAAGVLLLIPPGSYAQKCQVKPGNATVCLNPGATCSEGGGLYGRCEQLSDESGGYSVSVAVSEFSNRMLVLQDNGEDSLPISANGLFTFSKRIAAGKPYRVTVRTQPQGQTCTLGGNSSGTANGPVLVPVSCRISTGAPQVEVYVSYAENEHLPQAFMPNPWYRSPNTIFVGYPTSPPPAGTVQAWDTGGVLIRNVGSTDVVLGPEPKVDGFTDPTKSFSLWDSTAINPRDGLLGSLGIPSTGMAIHPGQQLILAQTGASRQTATDFSATPCDRKANPPLLCWSNFDTSDTNVGATGSSNTPIIHLMLNGVMQTFTDTAQVLNTGGRDLGSQAINESAQWRLIGTTGPYLPGGSGVNPPAVTTWHNDNSRTGLNSGETTLSPQSVNCMTAGVPCNFGKLFTYPVDGNIYAQPLFVPNVVINGARHNVVYVTTDNNSVYAFDAESAIPVSSGRPLWKRNFGPNGTSGFEVYSTPVIDTARNRRTPSSPKTNTLYLVSNSNGTSAKLHALDLETGNDKPSFKSPVTISGSVPGTGDNSNSGTITFATSNPPSPPFSANSLLQRPALLLYNGSVYVGFGSNGDAPPYHGWLFGYNAANLSRQTGIYNSTPNANSVPDTRGCPGWAGWLPAGGAFWMSGAGPAADATGLFATTGNGTADSNHDYGDSVLRLTPTRRNQPMMTVADSFTPQSQALLACDDLDFGSSGPVLVPGSGLPLLVQAAKDGTIYLLKRGSLGTPVQTLPGAIGNPQPDQQVEYGSPAYFNDTVFYKAQQDYLKAFQLTNGQFTTSPVATSANNTTGNATPSISYDSSQTSTAIVWTVETGTGPAVLHAYQASSLQELYNSSIVPSDSAGPAIPFPDSAPPTIAAGKVFVGTQGQLVVYGGGLAFPLQTGTLNVTLQVVPVNPRAKFDVAIDGTGQLSRATNNASTGPLAIASGAHLVSATPSPGTIGHYSISFSGACQPGGAVTLQFGNSATCTVTARLEVCPVGLVWNPVAGVCQRFPSCPSACKFGCYVPEITPQGPVWRCKPAP